LSEVEATSDRVLIIDKGRIVAQGAPRDLIARGAGATVRATVRGEGCREALAAAPFAESVEIVGGAPDGFARLAVRGRGGADVTVDLYRMAVERGWTLSELRFETATLEEVFANLTRGKA